MIGQREIEQEAPVAELVVVPSKGSSRPSRTMSRLASAASGTALGLLGAAMVLGVWQLVAGARADLPSPGDVASELGRLLASPLHDGGPNDRGIFLQLGASLRKVFTGFGLAALAGVPAGCILGASRIAWRVANPLVQLLRPVSPLAWFPLALVLFKDAGSAGVFTIGITALWPTLINTAVGVAGVPTEHRDVARVFRFGPARYVWHVLLPHAAVSIVTGLRLSMGIAWMVIVATEMLSGGSGIGFFVWDSYNNSNLAAVASAILMIGAIGFALDAVFGALGRRLDPSGARA